MTDAKLAAELRSLSRDFCKLEKQEQEEVAEVDKNFARHSAALGSLLRAVQKAKQAGHWRNTHVSVFDILGRPRLEEAHSSVLAWLLDPGESHGLSDLFLRAFMQKAIHKQLPNTHDVSVKREHKFRDGRFDIVVRGRGWELFIENKIDDCPWEDQYRKYEEYCQRRSNAWLIYITRHSQERPWLRHWISYRDVQVILRDVKPADAAQALITQFRDHILSNLEAE